MDRHPNNLPAQLSSFVGREQELAAATALLHRDDVRLLTLTGPGGVGKTRLALHIGTSLEQDFASGICFVSLAALDEIELVLPTIAQVLEIKEPNMDAVLGRLQSSLQNKQMLLILDNFEQVVSAAPSITKLLLRCPLLKILITSRTVLHLRGEQEFPVPPLSLPGISKPGELEAFTRSSAIALFCQRAQEVKPDFRLTLANAPAILAICQRLDGLPLALELAAARVKLLPPQALLDRLMQRQSVLTNQVLDVPARHRTLHLTIKWSYDLLNSNEQALFRHLSVFVGGFSLEAVQSVCQALGDGAYDWLDGITSLLDKSLLQQRELPGGEARLFYLETIREFGLECLVEAGEAAAAQQAHARYFCHLAETLEPTLFDAEQGKNFDLLEREHENMRATLRWLTEAGAREEALRLGVALARFWGVRGHVAEGQQWLQSALARSGQLLPPTRARALSWAGW
ncbi:MAG: NB-ARC domain-containing protein, partial [Chloroflexota bacterium]|nr:NB-ARC domain-containing protein [Chloroflexota bacterium]